ncbi:hypothetical protein GZ200_01420 [Dermatophilus congolensis]|uniref:hypothetical protein n=1 Tax=Dermatophilus congolensis TaxID=1863 RepID=UPI001AB008FD|nr:hypothetical protein [Dermatophilus congolensis]MBO3139366.1 hypothetical protein [Dermatophilus congolensis]MBO3166913.1 hypothetical protein [Dermatophilus congolensis]MBO3186656.1 hypothetical protein [Dermatophilus congolensis]MBO3193970.1 hypothetical protein [Dermatophilus congolensis]
MLACSLVAGPRDRVGSLPHHADVLGQLLTPGGWTFRCVADAPRGEGPVAHPSWSLRPAFGATESGVLLLGVALALGGVRGADEVGKSLVSRAQLDPGKDVLASSRLVDACRPLRGLPLAVVLMALVPQRQAALGEVGASLAGLTGWSVTVVGEV